MVPLLCFVAGMLFFGLQAFSTTMIIMAKQFHLSHLTREHSTKGKAFITVPTCKLKACLFKLVFN